MLLSPPAPAPPPSTPQVSDPPIQSDVPGPLSPAARELIWGVQEDHAAERLLGINARFAGRHYLTGDERHLEAFEPFVRDVGGAYVGVGSDQAYLFIGWAKSELAWLVDYDDMVVQLHRIYRALFMAAETPEGFYRLWTPEGAMEARAALEQASVGQQPTETLARIYTRSRHEIQQRLRGLRRSLGVPSYLNDPVQYDHIRRLFREDRIRPMLADLRSDGALRGIGTAARQLSVPVRVAYLSNAEEYWLYAHGFRENVRALPADNRSVVLRTLSSWAFNQDYRYNVQPLGDFQEILAMPWVRRVRSLVRSAPHEGESVPLLIPLRWTPATARQYVHGHHHRHGS